MRKLIEKGLMFGNLFEVSSSALVKRYNRALKSLTGKQTALSDFHIDISGYSPEVGDELGDRLYLNQGGCNRQFILLSTEQRKAPLLNVQFSTSRGILRRFIEANEAQLFALTARDAVAGELLNSVYDVSTAARLFDIRQITVEADTTESHVANAGKLAAMIDRFKQEPDAWWDDVLIADMIGVAKRTGDVMRNPVQLKSTGFVQENFWTRHFGGLYVFRALQFPVVIAAGSKAGLTDLPVPFVFDLGQREDIAKFLRLNDLVEPISKARGADAKALLRQKMDFILVDVAAEQKVDLAGATRRDLRRLARQHSAHLPEAFHGVAAMLRWLESGGAKPRITPDHPAYFYLFRSRPHADRDLVNMLLAELSPMDVRQMFICHKERFYADYAGWPESKKVFVADFLEREYQVDKAGARLALFGSDAPMEDELDEVDIIELVGPWGAVRRARR